MQVWLLSGSVSLTPASELLLENLRVLIWSDRTRKFQVLPEGVTLSSALLPVQTVGASARRADRPKTIRPAVVKLPSFLHTQKFDVLQVLKVRNGINGDQLFVLIWTINSLNRPFCCSPGPILRFVSTQEKVPVRCYGTHCRLYPVTALFPDFACPGEFTITSSRGFSGKFSSSFLSPS